MNEPDPREFKQLRIPLTLNPDPSKSPAENAAALERVHAKLAEILRQEGVESVDLGQATPDQPAEPRRIEELERILEAGTLPVSPPEAAQRQSPRDLRSAYE